MVRNIGSKNYSLSIEVRDQPTEFLIVGELLGRQLTQLVYSPGGQLKRGWDRIKEPLGGLIRELIETEFDNVGLCFGQP